MANVDRDQHEIDLEVERLLNLPTCCEYEEMVRREAFPWQGLFLFWLAFIAGFVAGALVVAYR